MQNAFVESFNGRFRDERLDGTLFSALAEARSAITSWKKVCNHHRPHSALDNMPPAGYAMKATLEKRAACGRKRNSGVSLGLKEKKFSGQSP